MTPLAPGRALQGHLHGMARDGNDTLYTDLGVLEAWSGHWGYPSHAFHIQ
jgi:hypothetical protein